MHDLVPEQVLPVSALAPYSEDSEFTGAIPKRSDTFRVGVAQKEGCITTKDPHGYFAGTRIEVAALGEDSPVARSVEGLRFCGSAQESDEGRILSGFAKCA